MSEQAVLIVNTKSRRGRECFAQAQQELRQRGVKVGQALACRDPRQVPIAVKKAVLQGARLVIVGGGDGTLGNTVDAFVGTESVLGVLPLGTGNEFARDLCIPQDVASACDVIANGKVTAVDLGIVNEHYFINVATVGLTTLIAQELTPDAKKRLGKLVYLFAVVRALMRVRPFCVTLKTAETTQSCMALQVVIGNGRFHAGPFPLSPDATITDGKLVVYILAGTSRWSLLRYALNLPGGHHVELPNVPAITTQGGVLETVPKEHVTVDGEICLKTPLSFGVKPRALRVMTPLSFNEAPGFE